MRRAALFLFGSLLALGLAPAHASPAPSKQTSAATSLQAVVAGAQDDDAAYDFREAARFGKPVVRFNDYSFAAAAQREARRRVRRAQLGTIATAGLGGDDAALRGVLAFELRDDPSALARYRLTFDLTPYQAPATFAAAHGILAAQPLATPAQAAAYVRLLVRYADMLDSLTAKVRWQAARGIYLPRAALPVTRTSWQGLAAAAVAVARPDADRTAALPGRSRLRLNSSVTRIVDSRIRPGFAALNGLIGPAYEARAPEAVGLSQYPDGALAYRGWVSSFTTLPLAPADLHARGLAAVATIAGQMRELREKMGFNGSARAFYAKINADPRFLAATPAAMEATYRRDVEAVGPRLPTYFRTLPRAGYGLERLPPTSEGGQTFGYYAEPGAADPRGIYHFNASNLDQRSLIGAKSLMCHELLPGHHLQIVTQSENTRLPPYVKAYWSGAFSEGWAEYAADLCEEMGIYDTPEALYGRRMFEMLFAARLVVDTGMNALGWPLDRARTYMRDLGIISDVQIDSETLRYATGIPGQALSYRVGYDEIRALRREAEQALGPAFDIRDFHQVVLQPASRPLAMLRADVTAYIASKRATPQR
jgi:uncharacterized protein (DUF885 family)